MIINCWRNRGKEREKKVREGFVITCSSCIVTVRDDGGQAVQPVLQNEEICDEIQTTLKYAVWELSHTICLQLVIFTKISNYICSLCKYL